MSRRDRFDQTPEDSFVLAAYQLFDWVGRHRALCAAAAVAAAGAVLAGMAYLNQLRAYNENAAIALDAAGTSAEYKAVVDTYPGSPAEPAALFRLGRKLADEERYQEAGEAFALLARSYPAHHLAPDALVFAGMLCAQQKKFDEAEKRYRGAAERYPGSFSAPRALLVLGACYEEMRRPDDAKAAYGKLVADYGSSDLAKDAEARISRLAQAPPAVETNSAAKGGEGGAPVE